MRRVPVFFWGSNAGTEAMFRHSWNISPGQAIELQKELARQVRIEPLGGKVRTVAGTDCAFHASGKRIVAVAVLCDARTMEVLETAYADLPCPMPYIPGLLSFREAPAVIEAIEKLSQRPDLLMCDGQGIAHPRGVGLSTHVGLWLDLPAIGVAKSRLCGEYRLPGIRKGCHTQLRYHDQVVGAVVRSRDNVKPLFVSIGHRITLPEAIRWTLRACRGVRLPEPTRRGHQFVTQCKREIASGQRIL